MSKTLFIPILDDEGLTRGLADPEARLLVEWLVEQAERLAEDEAPADRVEGELRRLCRWGRSVSRFVGLWCHEGEHGAAEEQTAEQRPSGRPHAPSSALRIRAVISRRVTTQSVRFIMWS